MGRNGIRLLAIPVAAAAAITAGVVAASPAMADVTDTGGTATVTVPFAYIAQLAKGGAVEIPQSPATTSADTTNQVVNVGLPVTGGNADASVIFGTLELGGSVKIATRHGCVTLTNIVYSIDDQAIEATPSGSSTPVPLLDLGGSIVASISGTTQSVTASELDVDSAGAAYLDSALRTSAFVAGDNAGSFSATWTVAAS